MTTVAPLALSAVLYICFLRLSSRWILGFEVGRALLWIWAGIQILLTVACVQLVLKLDWPIVRGAALGLLAHLVVGSAFFGGFATSAEAPRPGFFKAAAMMGAGLAMVVATVAVVLAIVSFLGRIGYH